MATSAAAYAAVTASTFVLRSGEQPGYSLNGGVEVDLTAGSFVSTAGVTGKLGTSVRAELRKAGFVIAAVEGLSGQSGAQGFSEVLEFKSTAGAKATRAAFFRTAKGSQGDVKLTAFSVPGVASAQGFVARGKTAASADAYWVAGRCELASGLYLPKGAARTVAAITRPVITGIEAQHKRIGTACP